MQEKVEMEENMLNEQTPRQIVEELPQSLAATLMILHGRIELRAVAGGQHHQAAQSVIFAQTHQPRTQFFTGKGNPLTNIDRSRPMV